MLEFLSSRTDKIDFYSFMVFFILSASFNGFLQGIYNQSFCILMFFFIEFIRRSAFFVLDKKLHKKSFVRYLFDLNKISSISFASALLICIFKYNIYDFNHCTWTYFGAWFFLRVIKYDDCTYQHTLWMENSNGLDYGSGMAYSFFHGYLRIVLPNRGDETFGLKELMDLYENQEGVKFPVKKLFILMPSTLYCPPDLSLESRSEDIYMEAAKNLQDLQRDRAGVKKRVYKNSVYKIYKNGKPRPIYVAAEGATPLLTLYNSLTSSSKHCENYKKHASDIVSQFYLTLKYLIESDVECKDVCELVFYDDKDVNLAKLLYYKICDTTMA